MSRHCLLVLLVIGAGLGMPAMAAGQSDWIGPGGSGGAGNWNTAGHWNPSGVPNNVGTSVTITLGISPVTLDISANIADLTVGADDSLSFDNGRSLVVNGTTITNNGQLNLNSVGSNTHLDFVGNVTLTGSGIINLGANANNRILNSSGAGSRLTISSGQTIRGSGSLGQPVGQGNFTNHGTISADQAAVALIIDPQSETFGGGSEGMINTGLIRAVSGATLSLNSASYLNTGAIIRADGAGSVINLGASAAILGGTLETLNGGVFRTSGNPTLENVTIDGTMNIQNGDTLNMVGTLTNHGNTLNLVSSGSVTQLSFGADATLAGTGLVSLSNSSQNFIRQTTGSGTNRLTIGANQTIQGSGQIGSAGSFGNFTNHGVITANQANGLTIDPQSTATGGGAEGFINNNLVQATSGATLTLAAGSYLNNGFIRADGAGSTVSISTGVIVVGGTLQSLGGGVFRTGGNPTLENVTIDGTMNIQNGDTLNMVGTLNNLGNSIHLQSAGSPTQLAFGADVMIDGTGLITLSNSSQNFIRQTTGSGNNRLTIGAHQTIRGSGQIGSSGSFGNFTNHGTIIADQATPLIIDPQSTGTGEGAEGFINHGTLRADQANLNLNAGSYLNGGVLEAVAGASNATVAFGGSTVLANVLGGTLSGGTYRVSAPGAGVATLTLPGNPNITNLDATVVLDGQATVFNPINSLNTVEEDGEFQVLRGRTFSTQGSLNNAGEIEVGAAATLNVAGIYAQGGGSLRVDGAFNAPNGAGVGGGGVLSGSGVIGMGTATLTLGDASYHPGSSAGTLDINGNLSLSAQSFGFFELAGFVPGDGLAFYDQFNVTGSALLAGSLQIDTVDGFNPVGGVFFIFTRGSGTGTFTNLNEGDVVLIDGGAFLGQITYQANWTGTQGGSTLTGGNDVAIFNIVPVPEPGSVALAAGALGLAWRLARRPGRRTKKIALPSSKRTAA